MFLLNSIWRDCTSLPSQYLSPSNQMYPQQVPNTLLTAFSPLNTTLSKQSLGCFFTFPNSILQESSFFTSRNEHSPNSSILTVPMKVELNSFFGQVPSITHPSLNSTLLMPLFFMVKELSPGEIQKSYMPENLQLSSGPMMRKQLMGGWCETCYAYIQVPSIKVACSVSPMMGLRGFKNMLRQYELARRQDTVILNLSTGSFSTAAWPMKQGKMVQLATELQSADLGWHALMGKDILVRLKSPEKIFLPIILTISFPTERSLSICFSSSHLIPPSEYAK